MNEKKILKDNTIVARCTKKEKEKIEESADNENKSISEYVISKCIPDKELIRDNLITLRKRQEFVNQIKHKINKCTVLDYYSFIIELMAIVKDEEDDIYACNKTIG